MPLSLSVMLNRSSKTKILFSVNRRLSCLVVRVLSWWNLTLTLARFTLFSQQKFLDASGPWCPSGWLVSFQDLVSNLLISLRPWMVRIGNYLLKVNFCIDFVFFQARKGGKWKIISKLYILFILSPLPHIIIVYFT